MKRLCITLLAVAACLSLHAQSLDRYWIIPPDSVQDLPLEEKLVRLAWNNYPANRMMEHQVAQSEELVLQNRKAWFNPVTVMLNYGEPHLNPDFQQNFFPRYNLGVMLNVGSFLATPNKIREAQQGVNIAQSNLETQKHTLRAEVLRRYFEYRKQLERYKIYTQNLEDANANYVSANQKYRRGEISLDVFNANQMAYNAARIDQIEAEGEMLIAKAGVEELIGIRLEDVR